MEKKLYLFSLVTVLLYGCSKNSNTFNVFTNFQLDSDTLKIEMDLSEAIHKGIILPAKANGHEYFRFNFTIKNERSTSQKYFYKIYYQNESYKLPEKLEGEESAYNPLSANNFYGSWENTDDEFHSTSEIPADGELHQFTDSFRIVGNPRNEEKYFGAEVINRLPDKEELKNKINYIKETPEWFAQIKEKAVKNNVSIDEQLAADARWVIADDHKKGKTNNRWKRNPRTGAYSFMLVICTEEEMKALPDYIRNIGKTDPQNNVYVNPFYYFKYRMKSEKVLIAKQVLKTHAALRASSGVYVNMFESPEWNFDNSYLNKNRVGNTDDLFYSAHFQQFFHNINKHFPIKNIPLVADVVNDQYSPEEYLANVEKYKNDRIEFFPSVTTSPGKTVGYDENKKAIYLLNPGNTDPRTAVKENTGIKTRIGFTYGKFRAKIHFPQTLNKKNMWNGITCAFWLLYQEEANWNMRCSCDSLGYIPKSEVGKTDRRDKFNSYSEIDIEIVKTSQYWPKASYREGKGFKEEDASQNHSIITACTNWDLACPDPKQFSTGVYEIQHNGKSFSSNRWDEYYKALTTKYAIDADSVLGQDMYFEIDWQPEKITWRLGKEKNNMIEFGYMDKTNTKIPDNQMIAVMTQEYHDATWWPPAPFLQDNIPFPAKDIVGYIYEIEVE